MQWQLDTGMERVVLEGDVDDFHEAVEAWMQDHQIDCLTAKDGTSVTLMVPRADLRKLRTLLSVDNSAAHPRGLYRAFLPPRKSGGITEVVAGVYFDKANAHRENAAGRHEILAALPSDLARLARRKKVSPAR